MKTFLVITGGLGNQLFQIAGALTTTSKDIHIVSCLGSPKKYNGNLEIAKLDFGQRVQIFECSKKHSFSAIAFRTMLSRCTVSKTNFFQKSINLILQSLSSVIISIHLQKLVYPRLSIGVGYDRTFVNRKGNLFIGYFQTYRLSTTAKEIITKALNQYYNPAIEQTGSSRSLLVHIRLGDYRNEPSIGMLDSSYYTRALENFRSKFDKCIVSLFSDEPESALLYLPKDLINEIKVDYLSKDSPLTTLCKMRGYENYILSNSTFGWWAAYTSPAQNVYVPFPWFEKLMSPNDLNPENWIRIYRD